MQQNLADSAMSLHIMEDVYYGHSDNPRHRQVANTAEEIVEPRPVHPDSHRLYKACDGMFAWTRYVPLFGPAIECYGPKFVFTLDFTEFMSKGLSSKLMRNSFLPMFFFRFNCTAMEYQRFVNVAMMGWSIKPFSALLSDTFAIFGYTKRWFLVMSSLVAAICNVIFGLLPAKHSSAATAAALAFLSGLGQANLDILSEGLYSRLMRQYPAAGPALVSSLWWLFSVAGIIAAVIVGPLSDSGMETVGPFISSACMMVVVPIFALNFYNEQPNQVERRADRRALRLEEEAKNGGKAQPGDDVNSDDVIGFSNAAGEPFDAAEQEEEVDIPIYCGGAIEFNREVLMRTKPLAVYAAVMTVGVIATVIVTINGSTWPLFGVCVGVSSILCAMSFWALSPVTAKVNLFAFFNSALYVSIGGPLSIFFTANEEQFPGGPHFSLFFFITTSSVIAYIAMLVGTTLFPYIFAKRSYLFACFITICATIVASIFDFIMVKRWNIDMGINDHYIFIFGDAMIGGVIDMLAWMPLVVLLSQLCPRGSESIVYALLAGFSNFGQRISGEIGTLLMDFVWPVDTSKAPFDFSNLPILIIVCHLCIPMLQLPLAYFLLPNARICDEVDLDGNVIGEKGHTERQPMVTKPLEEDSDSGNSPNPEATTTEVKH